MIRFRPAAKLDQEATVIVMNSDQAKTAALPVSSKPIRERLEEVIRAKKFEGENGQIFPCILKNKIFLLVGTGSSRKITGTSLRISIRNAFLSVYLKKVKSLEILFPNSSDGLVLAMIEAQLIGTYVWDKYKQKDKNADILKDREIYIIADKKKIYEDAAVICQGVNLARDLINDNADRVTSSYIEKTIRELTKGRKDVKLNVLNKKELQAKGLGLHLAVNQGSVNEPKLIIAEYRGTSKKGYDIAVIGKGMTFDTGGLNLKPTGNIETMRTDMSGAAAVVGTLKNTLALKLKRNVLFVYGLAENAIGARAYKPGDVIVGYAKKSVEIANTDAEGRLVLADAISYIVKNFKPSRLIDIATLTGACAVALGNDYSGLVSNDDKFARQVVHASNATDDRVWRLPSYPELKDSVTSEIADIRNLGFPKGMGGALTAAEFLRQFTEDTPWAHLDIAGTAFNDGKGRWYYGYGATGVGVRLLTHFLQHF